MKARWLLPVTLLGALAILVIVALLVSSRSETAAQSPPPQPPSDEYLRRAGLTNLREPEGPPAIAQDQALALARPFLDRFLGPEKARGATLTSRYLILTQRPSFIDIPAWIVSAHNVGPIYVPAGPPVDMSTVPEGMTVKINSNPADTVHLLIHGTTGEILWAIASAPAHPNRVEFVPIE